VTIVSLLEGMRALRHGGWIGGYRQYRLMQREIIRNHPGQTRISMGDRSIGGACIRPLLEDTGRQPLKTLHLNEYRRAREWGRGP